MGAYLKVFAEDGATYLGAWTEFSTIGMQQEFNGIGSITLEYPESGKDSSLVNSTSAILVPVIDGVTQDDWYLLEDDGDDPAAGPTAGRPYTIAGRGVLAFFEDAEVYPWNYDPAGAVTLANGDPGPGSLLNKATTHDFAAVTPGAIMGTFITRAKARGALLNIAYDFTDTHDSNGVAWPTNITFSYAVGTDYTKVLQGFADAGWADFRMRGLTLRMFVPNTVMGVSRPGVILHLGREVTSGPRKRTRRTVRNALLLVGDQGAIVEAKAAGLPAGTRRREGYDGRGGVTDVGTLTSVGQTEVGILQKPTEGFTLAYVPDADDAPQPLVDYGLGDFISYDQVRKPDNTGYLPMRVRTIAREFTPAGQSNVSIELNDIVLEFETMIARKIDALLNGSTSNSRAPKPPTDGPDDTFPMAPASISVESSAYTTATGEVRATATISWPAVTYNTDGSVMDDFGAYRYQLRFTGEAHWHGIRESAATVIIVSNLPPGGAIDVAVACRDIAGNVSDWTEVDDFPLAYDVTPPPVPSRPTVISWLGTLRPIWDGLSSTGASIVLSPTGTAYDANGVPIKPVPDFDHVNVYMSQAANFALGDPGVTKVGTLLGAADSLTVTDLPPGAGYYFGFTSVDRVGNESALSALSALAAPEWVVAPDIADAAVTSAKVATAAIDATKIAAAAVGAAQLGAGAVIAGKIAADAVDAAAIAAAAVGAGEIADGAVASAKIQNAAITTALIANAAITSAQIGTAAITTAKIANAAIGAAQIANAAIGTAQIANAAITTAQIGTAAVSTAQIVDAAILSAKIADAAVVTAKIGDAAITTAKIANLAVQDAQIATLSVGKVTAGQLKVNVQMVGKLTTVALDGNGNPVNSLNRVEVNSTGIGAWDTSGTLTCAIFANSGTLQVTGPIVSGGTITGALFQTASSGARASIGATSIPTYGNAARGMTVVGAGSQASYGWAGGVDQASPSDSRQMESFVISGGAQSNAGVGWENQVIVYPRLNSLGDETGIWSGVLLNLGGSSSASPSYLQFEGGGGGGRSTNVVFIQNYAASVGIRLAAAGNVECVNYNGGIFVTCKASAFSVSSDVRGKTDIADLPFSALEAVQHAPSKMWRRREERHPGQHFGPMAQDLPAHMILPSDDDLHWTDLGSMVGVLWEAVRELAEQVGQRRSAAPRHETIGDRKPLEYDYTETERRAAEAQRLMAERTHEAATLTPEELDVATLERALKRRMRSVH